MRNPDQIGCGYCTHEIGCTIRDAKTNKAKDGCPNWTHWEDDPDYKNKSILPKESKNKIQLP